MAEDSQVVNLNEYPNLPNRHEDEFDAPGPDGECVDEHEDYGDEEGNVVFVEHGGVPQFGGSLLALPLLLEIVVVLVVDGKVLAEEAHESGLNEVVSLVVFELFKLLLHLLLALLVEHFGCDVSLALPLLRFHPGFPHWASRFEHAGEADF